MKEKEQHVPSGTRCYKCHSDQPGQWNSQDGPEWGQVRCTAPNNPGDERTVYICSRACYGPRGEVLDQLKTEGWKWRTLTTMAPALPAKEPQAAIAETTAMPLWGSKP